MANKFNPTTLLLTAALFSNTAIAGFSTLIQPGTGTSAGTGSGTSTGTTGTGTTTSTIQALSATDDTITVVPGKTNSVTGSVVANDYGITSSSGSATSNAWQTVLQSSPVSDYGMLEFNSNGAFTYTVYNTSPKITSLQVGQVLKDTFTYTLKSGSVTSTAKLVVTIIANPTDANGNTLFPTTTVKNVEIEFNNRSTTATPLNPGQLIKGALYASNDRDWYSIGSTGNEIINIEVCAQGSVCAGKKNWVMYVFDGDKLTSAMEDYTTTLYSYVTETGALVPGSQYSVDDMYLSYNMGAYEGALIDVIDPCYGDTNKVDVGVPANVNKTYFVAISVPLKRDETGCSSGSVILKKPGRASTVTDLYVSAYPNSDDEYDLTVTHTGLQPLAIASTANAATANSAIIGEVPKFYEKTHTIIVPKLRIINDLYTGSLTYKGSIVKKSVDSSQVLTMTVKKVIGLNEPLKGNPYQVTFNPDNDEVVVPKIMDSKTGLLYSAVLKYHPATAKKALWLEATSVTPLQ